MKKVLFVGAFAFIINGSGADDGPVDDGIDRALDILARS